MALLSTTNPAKLRLFYSGADIASGRNLGVFLVGVVGMLIGGPTIETVGPYHLPV